METDDHIPTARQKGAALVMVIWAIGILAFYAADIATNVRLQTENTSTTKSHLQAEALLEGGARLAVSRWDAGIETEPAEIWSCRSRIGIIKTRIVPANSKVSLNQASEGTLEALMLALGLERDAAKHAAAAIADYRDADDTPRPFGAESTAYKNAGYEGLPRNGPFITNSEIAYVPAIPQAILPVLRDEISVHNRQPSIDRKYASDIAKSLRHAAAIAQTRSQQPRRRSSRQVSSGSANTSNGIGPVVVVVSVVVGNFEQTVEFTYSGRSTRSGARRLLERRSIYHYSLPLPGTGEDLPSCANGLA